MKGLEILHMKSCGLSELEGLADKFPNLNCLDISYNEILSMDNIPHLLKLESLSELDLSNNPICVHDGLKTTLSEGLPFLEVYNKEQLVEEGAKFKDDAHKLQIYLELPSDGLPEDQEQENREPSV